MSSLTDFTATALTGDERSLSEFAGQVTLVVNTASKCGFAPQFEGLEALHQQFQDQGFTVLGFPSNQFKQELADAEDIGAYCQKNYGVTFPMFATVDVNGRHAHPVYQWLRSEAGGALGSAIKWNFTKFLVGRDGHVIKRYGSSTEPAAIAADIEAALTAD
ncbi:glutathione peroxidase [Demequina muriae]|uniref:Glutathione peroxidase n=1 Tax=Demequina muriae TaxID=3051664 RepID=A0ABT8GIV4_9MICO|nr:glutathione peroxidase [Demequina sp. EGI L300058]MDN4481367.1 glutathione peroxidase [Demequina sp. EGI L300058]